MNDCIIRCNNLTKKYGSQLALNNLNLELPKGQIIGMLGPNGSGKTTLIKLMNGLLTPTSGNVFINEMKPGPGTKAIVSYLPEKTHLKEWMKVNELVKLFADFYSDFDVDRANRMLTDLGISPNAVIKTLSKGTQEKVQLILIMSRRAKLYVLDEPIGGVDPAARDYILNTILRNYDPEATIIISTHLITDIEKILDYVVFLQYGNLRMAGFADDIREQSGKSIDMLFREVFRC